MIGTHWNCARGAMSASRQSPAQMAASSESSATYRTSANRSSFSSLNLKANLEFSLSSTLLINLSNPSRSRSNLTSIVRFGISRSFTCTPRALISSLCRLENCSLAAIQPLFGQRCRVSGGNLRARRHPHAGLCFAFSRSHLPRQQSHGRAVRSV